MDFFVTIVLGVLRDTGVYPFNYRYLLTQIILVVSVIIIELGVLGWKKSSLKKIIKLEKSTRVDLTAFLVESFSLYNFISLALSLGLCYFLAGMIQNQLQLNLHIQNKYLQFCIIFLFSDLKSYCSHYCFHKVIPLWQLHAFHHSANQFTILTRTRGHFLETEISRFFDVIPFVIFGAPLISYFTLKIILELIFMLQNSAIESNWGFVGKYILVSPAAHHLHHSENEGHYNKNFGSVFIFWDRIFGTYHPPIDNATIGIVNDGYNKKNYVYDIVTCQVRFLKETIRVFTNLIKTNKVLSFHLL